MRTAPIAAYFPNDSLKRKAFTEAQSRLTHSDPKATIAATAITELTALFLTSRAHPSDEQILESLTNISEDQEWLQILESLKTCFVEGRNLQDLLLQLGANPAKGISGYVYQTVPCVLLTGLRNQWDFETTITELIATGGDTDTTAAIAGALCGSLGGIENIPKNGSLASGSGPLQRKISPLLRTLSRQNPRSESDPDGHLSCSSEI